MTRTISQSRIKISSYWPEGLTALVLLIAWTLMHNITLSHDVVWQLWIARQLLDGSKLYVDILEVNPPLWFWMALPVEYVAQRLTVSAHDTLMTFIFVYAAIGLFLIAIMEKTEPPLKRAILLLSIAIIMLLINLNDIAQREHLTLIGTFPYVFLIAQRVEKKPISIIIATSVGFIASIGFAFKHYFILLPIFIEFFLIYRLKSYWTIFRNENFVIFFCGIFYIITLLILTPEYFTNIFPLINSSYNKYSMPLFYQLTNFNVIYWLSCATTIFLLKINNLSSVSWVSAIATLAFATAYFAQQKGWNYHAMPATGMMCFFIISVFFIDRNPNGYTLASFTIAAIITCLPFTQLFFGGSYKGISEEVIKVVKYKAPPGTSILALTTNPSVVWPAIASEGYKWPSRHFTFWMLVPIYGQFYSDGKLSPELQNLADKIRAQTVEDISCNPPSVIVVDNFFLKLNILSFFRKNYQFNELFSEYKLYENKNEIEYYYNTNIKQKNDIKCKNNWK